MEWSIGKVLLLLILLFGAGDRIYCGYLHPEEKYTLVTNVSTEVEEIATKEGMPVFQMEEIVVGDKQVEVTNILSYVDEINVNVDGGGVVGRARDAQTFMAAAEQGNATCVYWTMQPSNAFGDEVYRMTKAYAALDWDRHVIVVLTFTYDAPGTELVESYNSSAIVFAGMERT